MVVNTNEKLFDLLNEWSNTVLEPTSNVGDTKQYVNQLYKILPLFINQSIIFSDTVLTQDSSWETIKPNTIHYFNALGGEGTPDSSMVKSQAGYLLYINSTATDKGLQICVTEDLNVLFRFAPKGTWIMNATNLSVTQLTDKINDFAEQIDEKGLDALQLRTEALNGKISDVKTQVQNSAVGTNLLLKTSEPLIMTGNNTVNQNQQMYALSKRIEAGTTVTLSFDAVATTPTQFSIQNDGNNSGYWFYYSYQDMVDNTKKHYVATITLDKFLDLGVNMRLDKVPSTTTVTISNMKLELGSNATDYSLNPEDISTNDSVQIAIANSNIDITKIGEANNDTSQIPTGGTGSYPQTPAQSSDVQTAITNALKDYMTTEDVQEAITNAIKGTTGITPTDSNIDIKEVGEVND